MTKKISFFAALFLSVFLFSALSHAAVGDKFTTSFAFNTANNRYLVVYMKYDGSQYDIYGQIINHDGTAIGSEFVISNAANNQLQSSVAYDSINERFLVTWNDDRGGTSRHIYAQLVNTDGALLGVNFIISDANSIQAGPSVAYDPLNQRFLVTWHDNRSGNWDIYGQLVNADGTLYSTASNTNFVISDATNAQAFSKVTYDSINQRFLVVFVNYDGSSAISMDIYGQLVNADGTLYNTTSNTNFVISNAVDGQVLNRSVAYDSINQRFLVAWHDWRNNPSSNPDIYGQLVNADGTLYNTTSNTNFVISNATNYQYSTSVGYDSTNQKFLVAWNDGRNITTTKYDIYAQLVNTDGTLYNTASNTNFVISDAADYQFDPIVTYNSICSNFLVAYRTYVTYPTTPADIAFGLVGNPCETTPPTVSSTSPANNTTDVSINTSITVTFSEAMRSSTINTSTFTISSGVTGTATYDEINKIATFIPSSSLAYSTTYTATITTGVKDAAGNAMAADYTWSFTTEAPPVYNLSVYKAGTGSGTVTSAPSGISCGADCSATYAGYTIGTAVTLTASPAVDSVFAGWGGDADCSDGVVTMDANKTCAAAFTLKTYTVSPSAGTGGSISPNTSQTVNYGGTVYFTIAPDTGYHIASVTGCGGALSGNTYTTGAITSDCTVTASFAINTYTITAAAGAGGAIAPAGAVTVNYGANQTFAITPDTGFHLADVLVDGVSAGAVTAYTFSNVTIDHTIAAGFVINTYTFSVNKSGAGSGRVTSSPSGIDCGADCSEVYNHGTVATLTATADANSNFIGWTGDADCTDGVITIDANKTCTAQFNLKTYTLTASVNGNGAITSSPSGISCPGDCSEAYTYGATVTLTPAPAVGWTFTGWAGTCSGTAACTVTMTADTSVTTGFTQTWFEESDSAITYTGAWSTSSCALCSSGAMKYTGQTWAKANLSFNGTGIKWIAARSKNSGKANIYIDGAYSGTVDLYSRDTQYKVAVFTKTGLAPGNHTITIEFPGKRLTINIDAFEAIP